MNPTIKTLLTRRSVRKYLPQQITDQQLDIILQTALYAPTGGNNQLTRFIVIQNQNLLEEFKILTRERMAAKEIVPGGYQNAAILRAREGKRFDCLMGAPTIIHVVAPKTYDNAMADSANAIQNMQIAATSLNLGACWVNVPHWLTNDAVFRQWMERLGMRPDEDIYGSVVIGYPAGELPSAAPRKPNRIQIIK